MDLCVSVVLFAYNQSFLTMFKCMLYGAAEDDKALKLSNKQIYRYACKM